VVTAFVRAILGGLVLKECRALREGTPMRYGTSMVLLFLAAALESGGDALMRSGIHSRMMTQRSLFFVAGGLILTAYGYIVNAPPWQFGRLLGAYVTIFSLSPSRLARLRGKTFRSRYSRRIVDYRRRDNRFCR
jgi:hypothetical protein